MVPNRLRIVKIETTFAAGSGGRQLPQSLHIPHRGLAEVALVFPAEVRLVVVADAVTRYVERGRFKQPDRTRLPAWAHPVIANGKMYIRDQDVLFCYDVKRK